MKVISVNNQSAPVSLKLGEKQSPVAGPGQVLLRVRASSLNFHDLAVITGMIPVANGRIPMSDAAGDVVVVGEGVGEFQVGDKVLSTFFPAWLSGPPTRAGLAGVPGDNVDGFAAEFVALPAHTLTRIPAGYSYEQAATLPCAALTAWRGMFVENHLKPGDWVLTQGTGGVSLFALQFAKSVGARVIATSSSAAKLEQLRELGADHVINYREVPDWGAKALEITGGRGVDEIVEVGGPATMAQSIEASAIGGHISLIGVLTGVSGDVPTAKLFSKNITVSGITVGSKSEQEAMIAAIDACGIEPVIDRVFPFEELAAAFEYQQSQQHFGKIVVTW